MYRVRWLLVMVLVLLLELPLPLLWDLECHLLSILRKPPLVLGSEMHSPQVYQGDGFLFEIYTPCPSRCHTTGDWQELFA
jgi:hypothetical protein